MFIQKKKTYVYSTPSVFFFDRLENRNIIIDFSKKKKKSYVYMFVYMFIID